MAASDPSLLSPDNGGTGPSKVEAAYAAAAEGALHPRDTARRMRISTNLGHRGVDRARRWPRWSRLPRPPDIDFIANYMARGGRCLPGTVRRRFGGHVAGQRT